MKEKKEYIKEDRNEAAKKERQKETVGFRSGNSGSGAGSVTCPGCDQIRARQIGLWPNLDQAIVR